MKTLEKPIEVEEITAKKDQHKKKYRAKGRAKGCNMIKRSSQSSKEAMENTGGFGGHGCIWEHRFYRVIRPEFKW